MRIKDNSPLPHKTVSRNPTPTTRNDDVAHRDWNISCILKPGAQRMTRRNEITRSKSAARTLRTVINCISSPICVCVYIMHRARHTRRTAHQTVFCAREVRSKNPDEIWRIRSPPHSKHTHTRWCGGRKRVRSLCNAPVAVSRVAPACKQG